MTASSEAALAGHLVRFHSPLLHIGRGSNCSLGLSQLGAARYLRSRGICGATFFDCDPNFFFGFDFVWSSFCIHYLTLGDDSVGESLSFLIDFCIPISAISPSRSSISDISNKEIKVVPCPPHFAFRISHLAFVHLRCNYPANVIFELSSCLLAPRELVHLSYTDIPTAVFQHYLHSH